MGYQFWGENLHEIAGVIIFIFFIFHHVLNRNWYRNLFKGKYILVRIFQICINIMLLAAMILMMYSGIVMSQYVFNFLPIRNGFSLVRKLHILGAYWDFMLMSIHWGMITGMIKIKEDTEKLSWLKKAFFFCWEQLLESMA